MSCDVMGDEEEERIAFAVVGLVNDDLVLRILVPIVTSLHVSFILPVSSLH